MPAAPINTLLVSSWSVLRRRWWFFFIGAIIFGSAFMLVQNGMEQWMMHTMRTNTMNDSAAPAGDTPVIQGDGFYMATQELVDINNIVRMLLPIFFNWLIIFVLQAAAMAYYTWGAMEATPRLSGALLRLPMLTLRITLLWIWIVLRSFAWIPIIGGLFAIIFTPRLILAVPILVRENKGILESARLSYQRTSGYWGKIIGNSIIFGVVSLPIVLAGTWIAGSLISASITVSVWLMAVVTEGALSWAAIGLYQLERTITQNPLSRAK